MEIQSPESKNLNFSQNSSNDELLEFLQPQVQALGYQIIHLEFQTHPQKTLKVFIDFIDNPDSESRKPTIGIKDCIQVSQTLNSYLDNPDFETQLKIKCPNLPKTLLNSHYELEVSSPGINRPLRNLSDFQKFLGNTVAIQTFRPLTKEEIENENYYEKNPKQKKFKGILTGLKEDSIIIEPFTNLKCKKKPSTQRLEQNLILIPIPLVSKANLEPHFDFESAMKESRE